MAHYPRGQPASTLLESREITPVKSLIIFATVVLKFQYALAGDLELRAKKIAQDLDTVAKTCPQKVWPQENLKKVQVALRDDVGQRVWLWNSRKEGSQVIYYPYKDLPDELRQGLFGFAKVNEVDTMAIGLKEGGDPLTDPYGDEAFDLVAHEGFHQYFQNTWEHGEAEHSDPRGEVYPADWRPRYLRRQVLMSMIRAYLEPERINDHLGAAAYWQFRLRTAFAQELEKVKNLDVKEGSARYVEEVSAAVAELGCNFSEDQFANYMKKRLEKTKSLVTTIPSFSQPGIEYYQLGFAASLLLRQLQFPGWEQKIMDHNTPVDILLSSVTPVPQPDDPKTLAFIKLAVKNRNEELGPLIEPSLTKMSDRAFVRVSVPFKWVSGSYSSKGFVHIKGQGVNELIMLNKMVVQSPSKVSKITFQDVTISEEPTNICGPFQAVAFVPKNELSTNGQKVYGLSNHGVNGTLKGKIMHDQRGFTWLCVTE